MIVDRQKNALLRAIQAGLVDPESLDGGQMATLMDQAPAAPDVPATQPNTMRVESGPDAGKVTSLNFQPQSMADFQARFDAARQPAQQQPTQQTVNLKGYGNNGIMSDLGSTVQKPVALDYARGAVDTPAGRGFYGKDGAVYVKGDDGSLTKILLGYDQAASMAMQNARLAQEKTGAEIAHTQEATRASQVNNPDLSSPGTAAGAAMNAGVTGDDFLKTLDPATAGIVKTIAEGKMAPPGQFALKSPRVLQLLSLAGQYEPGFDATTWAKRYATTQEFAKGKSYQSVNALNTVAGHLDQLDQAIDALGNSNVIPALTNPIENAIGKNVLGSTKQTNYATVLQTVIPELERAYRGAGGSEGSLQRWRDSLSGNNGYDQQKSAVRELAGLLQSKIDALGESYNQGMGTSTSNGFDRLSPKAAAVFQRLLGASNAGGAGSTAPATTIPAPRMGEIRRGYAYIGGDPASPSSWKPMQ